MKLATYFNTVIVPYFSSRNSRAFTCLAVIRKYFPMKSSWNSPHVIASMSLEALTKSYHTWDSSSSWNAASLIFVASELISMAFNIFSICRKPTSQNPDYHDHLFSEPLRFFSLTLVFILYYIHPVMHIFHTICNTQTLSMLEHKTYNAPHAMI